MRHEEKYCIWSGSSIGGCPLEEASEQERIPSIIGSIVWCCPTSRVWYIIKCGFFYLVCGSIVYSVFVVIIFSDLVWFLTIGIRALSLAGVVGNYFLFLQIFFRRRKKRAATFQTFSVYFCAKFVEKGCISEFLSEKHPI
jgi:hypothetical protein